MIVLHLKDYVGFLLFILRNISTELGFFDVILDDTLFEDEVTVKIAVKEDLSESLLNRVTDAFCGRIVPKIVGKRIDTK